MSPGPVKPNAKASRRAAAILHAAYQKPPQGHLSQASNRPNSQPTYLSRPAESHASAERRFSQPSQSTSGRPSSQPTHEGTRRPSSQPALTTSGRPSSQPTHEGTRRPSSQPALTSSGRPSKPSTQTSAKRISSQHPHAATTNSPQPLTTSRNLTHPTKPPVSSRLTQGQASPMDIDIRPAPIYRSTQTPPEMEKRPMFNCKKGTPMGPRISRRLQRPDGRCDVDSQTDKCLYSPLKWQQFLRKLRTRELDGSPSTYPRIFRTRQDQELLNIQEEIFQLSTCDLHTGPLI